MTTLSRRNRAKQPSVATSSPSDALNNKHKKALDKIINRRDISWSDVRSMFNHMGAIVSNNNGSSVKIEFNKATLFLHIPHGGNEHRLPKGMLRRLKAFLQQTHVI